MAADVPTGETEREPAVYDAERVLRAQRRNVEQGYRLVTTLVVDPAGEPAGYTLMYVTADGVNVLQDDTFVLAAHRGRRLGTRAKVANLRALAAGHPDARHVHTWTAEVNDAMQAVNARFGFRSVETMHEMEATL
jgi:RimJ/RimL family protein N-acetyltransferase